MHEDLAPDVGPDGQVDPLIRVGADHSKDLRAKLIGRWWRLVHGTHDGVHVDGRLIQGSK